MRLYRTHILISLVVVVLSCCLTAEDKTPLALALSPDGRTLYVACRDADTIVAVDTAQGKIIAEKKVGRGPFDLRLDAAGKNVFVTCRFTNKLYILAAQSLKLLKNIGVGPEPCGLAVSADGSTAYVATALGNDIAVVNIGDGKIVYRVPTERMPMYVALSPDGRTLYVSHLLRPKIACVDTKTLEVTRSVEVQGAASARGIVADANGAYVVHLFPRSKLPPTQMEQGWIMTSGLTLIPAATEIKPCSFTMDFPEEGAADPYGAALLSDSSNLFITHRGGDKVSCLDLPALWRIATTSPSNVRRVLYRDMTILYRRNAIRVFSSGGYGPCGIAIGKHGRIYVANAFSDSIAFISPSGSIEKVVNLSDGESPSLVRRGEILFHSAAICYQKRLSCSSCHPEGRSDGLTWDLLNDGIGNPKVVKSLVGSADTPPAMSTGVRKDMPSAVEAGLRFILFHEPTKDEIDAVSAYISSIPFRRSPYLNPKGKLSDSAQRGKHLFEGKANCASCHNGSQFTDCNSYNVGTGGPRDGRKIFDTPGLRELFLRPALLHDGRAKSVEEVLTKYNDHDRHGITSKLTKEEIADLVAYLLSL